jgi:hypothetical protein
MLSTDTGPVSPLRTDASPIRPSSVISVLSVTGGLTSGRLPFITSPSAPDDRLVVPGLPRQRPLSTRLWHALARIAWDDLPVRYLGTMPLFAGHRVYAGASTDWVVLNLADDPLFHDRHGFPIPGRVLDDLRRVERSLEFDALFVAHEVPRGAVVEDRPIPREALLPPGPRPVVQQSERFGEAARLLWALAAAPLVLSGAAAALVASATAAMGAGLALDPILLGVVVAPERSPEPGEPAAWFCLGRWVYGEG